MVGKARQALCQPLWPLPWPRPLSPLSWKTAAASSLSFLPLSWPRLPRGRGDFSETETSSHHDPPQGLLWLPTALASPCPQHDPHPSASMDRLHFPKWDHLYLQQVLTEHLLSARPYAWQQEFRGEQTGTVQPPQTSCPAGESAMNRLRLAVTVYTWSQAPHPPPSSWKGPVSPLWVTVW